MKQLFLPYRIESAVNVRTRSGASYCHVIVDDAAALELLKAGAIDKWENAPANFKEADGTPSHSYQGLDVTKMGKIADSGEIP